MAKKTTRWRKSHSFSSDGFTIYLRYGKDDDGTDNFVWRANVVRVAPPLHCGNGKSPSPKAAIAIAVRSAQAFFARQSAAVERVARVAALDIPRIRDFVNAEPEAAE